MKSNDAEINLRVSQVYTWLCWYWPTHKIVAEGCAKWNVGERQIAEYISAAKELIYSDNKEDRVEILKESIKFWKEFIGRCIQEKDRKQEAIGRKQLDKITGIENYYDQASNGTKTLEIKLIEVDKQKPADEA